MSNGKRFALPTQKGTELFPNVTQPPAKLVIRGVPPDAPLYRVVADTFAGRLKSFHAKGQQTYALSDNQVATLKFNWGDARAVYTNLQGQEIIELEVDVPILQELEKQLKPEHVPDWAVVDIRVNDTADREILFSAVLVNPKVNREDDTFNGVPINGIEFDDGDLSAYHFDYSDIVSKPFIQFADPKNTHSSVTGITDRVASILVDFRSLPMRGAVTFDLYQSCEGDTETIDDPPVFIGWTQTNIENRPNWGIFGYDHAEPGELSLDGGETMNPVCKTDEVIVAELSAVIAGSPNPNTICFRFEIGGEIIGQGGANAANSQAVDTLNSEHPQVFDANFIRIPPEGYTDAINGNHFYDSIKEATWAYTLGTETLGDIPEPYDSLGYDFRGYNTYAVYENTLFYNKQPVYDYPSHDEDVPLVRDADLTFNFYDSGDINAGFFDDSLDDYSGMSAAMWVIREGQIPRDRVKFATTTIDSSKATGPVTIDNPRGWGYLGRVTLDRYTRSIGWKPAAQ